jgi:hypothetical protein
LALVATGVLGWLAYRPGTDQYAWLRSLAPREKAMTFFNPVLGPRTYRTFTFTAPVPVVRERLAGHCPDILDETLPVVDCIFITGKCPPRLTFAEENGATCCLTIEEDPSPWDRAIQSGRNLLHLR